MILLIGASLAVWPFWIGPWGRVVLGYHRYATPPLASVLPGSSLEAYCAAVLIAVAWMTALALVWRCRAAAAASYEFGLTLSLLLAITTITILPGQSVFDHVVLLPGIFLLASRKQPGVRVQSFARSALVGRWFGCGLGGPALGLIVLRPFRSPEPFYSGAVFALPLRTAATFPFVVLGSLALVCAASRDGGES
jgi:hypothetical protein